VTVLSACGGNGAGSPVGAGPVALPNAPTAQAAWMARDAETRDLLYVSNHRDGSVDVYSYPDGKLNGWLRDLRAMGLCADKNGDVFVPNGNEIREYAHGGTRPVAVLRDPLGGATQFCAVDPVTGNLAVSGGTSREYGVTVYANAAGNPKVYPGIKGLYWSCTFDDAGNLFVEVSGAGLNGAPQLLELPKAGTQLRSIDWKRIGPSQLGSIQWDGKYLAAESGRGGPGPTTIARYAVRGTEATLEGRATLAGAQSPLRFWTDGTLVAVLNRGSSNGGAGSVLLYNYPKGDGPTRTIEDANEPQAAVLSRRRHRKFAVITYHYDTLRTGWNDKESLLNYGNVGSASFGLLHSVALDDQVDTQPLVVPDVTTTRGVSPGKHDVVYVTTEHDSVYAIDASSGTVLFQQSLGNPVPTPLGCNNNGPNVGIDGTPVIDKQAGVMYVIAYTLLGSVPTYTIHELSLDSLTDVVTPVVVTASHTLSNGYPFTFNATYQRQRPALLEANGTVYAGFGSFCDFAASTSRGWLLGWQAGSLAPLPANQLDDVLPTSPYDFFLSSIWMSGYGIAADDAGNVYFVTGNSDPSGTTYNSVTNISETAAELSPDLTHVESFFTPSDVGQLDQSDADFGAGGMLLLPKVGSQPPLAAAAGKDGNLYLMNRRHLGGYTPSGPNHVVDTVNIGGCWCGESYFDAASDSTPRIVASGGNNVTVWKVPTSRPIRFGAAGSSPSLPGGQDPGFFTTVSSNGTNPGAIIWAIARPQYVPGNITLFAFTSEPGSGGTLQTLYQAPAGTWASSGGNANLVPVVANGKVYVASYEQLDIFGLVGSGAKGAAPAVPAVKAPHVSAAAPNEVTGKLVAIKGSYLTLITRSGKMVRVDDALAVRGERSSLLIVGEAFSAQGKYDAAGILHAAAILRAKPSPATWPPDR
jgi:hypothetical protein